MGGVTQRECGGKSRRKATLALASRFTTAQAPSSIRPAGALDAMGAAPDAKRTRRN
jgi:hypothetical protein